MIYDGHVCCFPDLGGDGGFADPEQLRRDLQLGITRHGQPVWRKRDRAPADSGGLAHSSAGWSFEALKDARFRASGYGRFEGTADGVDYVKQYMPPSVVDMSYPSVDMALLDKNPYLDGRAFR